MVEGGIISSSSVSTAPAASAVESSASVNKTVHVPGLPPLTRREFLNYAWLASLGLAFTGAGAGAWWWFFGRGPQTPPIPGAQQPNPTAAPGATLTQPGSNVNAQPQPTTAQTPASSQQGDGNNQQQTSQEASKTPEKESTTLREAADRIGFKIGVGVGGYTPDGENYRQLIELQAREFNLGMIYMFWGTQEQTRGQPIYKSMLSDLNVAKKAAMTTLGHPLIWSTGYSMPPWVQGSRDELIKAMEERISGVATQVGDGLDSVVVVNEAYIPANRDIFLQTIGPEYVDIAFEMARKYFPKTKLVYNDTDNHTASGTRTKNTQEIVKRLNSKGLIDKVGVQGIVLRADKPPSREDVRDTMRSYEGLPVVVTEAAVNIKDLVGDQQTRWEKQKQIYADLVGGAIDSGVCREFTIFQIVDKYSIWSRDPRYGANQSAEPTPFDNNFQPKPAYYAILNVLKSAAKTK